MKKEAFCANLSRRKVYKNVLFFCRIYDILEVLSTIVLKEVQPLSVMRKKKLLLIIIAVVLPLVLLLSLVPLWIGGGQGTPDFPEYSFADESLSRDIYSDADYMQLDRLIYYKTIDGYELTVPILDADYHSQSKEVRLLVDFVKAAIEGDEVAYNACFAAEYVAKSGEAPPFTMQKLYDILIIDYRKNGAQTPPGYDTVHVFGLRYKIKDNNGSLRADMGSDAEREQYISVVKDGTGRAYIYGVETRYT